MKPMGTARRLLPPLPALLRAHLPPLPAQLLTLRGRHLPEPLILLTDALLLLRRQRLELLPALAQHLPLLRRQRAPLLEALLSGLALLRRHRQPALRAPRERRLPLGRQLVPLPLEVVQQLLLRGRERGPGSRLRRRRGRSRRCSSRRLSPFLGVQRPRSAA